MLEPSCFIRNKHLGSIHHGHLSAKPVAEGQRGYVKQSDLLKKGRKGPTSDLAFLSDGGEMRKRIRSFNWSKTPLGPVTAWPQNLKTALGIMLNSRYPMFIWWGSELTKFYNDSYIPMLGKRHPEALGKQASEVWSDVWPVVGPQTEVVLNEGRSTWNEELLLVMERNGFAEEAYFTFSYSPVPGDYGTADGIFCAVTEDTGRVLSQRRLRTLRVLAEQTAEIKTAERACEVAALALAENQHDLPFVLLYLLDDTGHHAKLAGMCGAGLGSSAGPAVVSLENADSAWPFHQVVERGTAVEVTDLSAKFGPLPGGAWPESPQRAIVLPMAKAGSNPTRRIHRGWRQPPAGVHRRLQGVHGPLGRSHRDSRCQCTRL